MAPTTAATSDFTGWAVFILLLGIKHGFDADHLAAIDAMTRRNALDRPALARCAGVLFSLGHGSVVVLVALVASQAAAVWRMPGWLDAVGAWMSIAVLCGLAAVNILAALRAGPDRTLALIGWRAGFWHRSLGARHPAALMAVGALFALSFDTFGLATSFALAARPFGGGQSTVTALASVFVAGMLVADGANGWWISQLIRRADQAARIASRVMALAVSGVGLLTAGLGIAMQADDRALAWAQGKELWFGAAVIAIVALSYLLACRLARTPDRRSLVSTPGL